MNLQCAFHWKRPGGKSMFAAGLAVMLCLPSVQVCADNAVQSWVQRYNGPGNDMDQAQAIVVDGQGDVIVAGSSAGSGSALDYVIIKYSNAGVPLWTNRYDGPASGPDFVTGLAVDHENNIVVTGYSAGTSDSRPVSVDHYATVKYSSSGVPLWTNRYVGPVEFDHAAAVAIDAENNVIVTGSSSDTDFPYFRFVYATVKYSSTGVPLWVNRYSLTGFGDSASAVAVDGIGNVIVTGGANTASGYADCVTIKYSGEGDPLWTNRFNGAANRDDVGKAVAVDGGNNVIVTGHSYASTNYSNADYLTIKYSSTGVLLWSNRFDGPTSGNDFARALAVDGNSNVIVTGESFNGTNRDYATILYSSAGAPLWTNRYNGPANSDDAASAAKTDTNGTVTVTGYSCDDQGHADYTTIQYSSTGEQLWSRRYDGPGNENDFASALALDAGGNVFVTGSSSDGVHVDDFATIKYSILHPVHLDIRRMNECVVLSWTNAAFGLQCAPDPAGPFTDLTGATSPCTNPMTGERQFFRLRFQ